MEKSASRYQVRIGHSRAGDARVAVGELHASLAGVDAAVVFFFCSSHYELDCIAREVNRLFAGVTVVGCTTAGEFGPKGYATHGLSGLALPASAFRVTVGRLDELSSQSEAAPLEWARRVVRQLDVSGPSRQVLGVLLIDGLCGREERLARACQLALGDAPMVGGSAGDDLRFSATHVFSNGAFQRDRAVLTVMETSLPFEVLQAQHFIRGPRRLVVTRADAARRIVHELDGSPAALEYARAIGVSPEALTDQVFSAAPLVVRINGVDYVRSIRSMAADGSLTLFCAIDRGVVLRVGRGGDFLESRRAVLAHARRKLGPLEAVLGFDCIHCSLEAERSGLKASLEAELLEHRAVGFTTYGEQFMGVHLNQTLTGVAFGERAHE